MTALGFRSSGCVPGSLGGRALVALAAVAGQIDGGRPVAPRVRPGGAVTAAVATSGV